MIPAIACDGVIEFEVTPVPVHVPPAGLAYDAKETGAASEHTSGIAVNIIVGNAFTVKVALACGPSQP